MVISADLSSDVKVDGAVRVNRKATYIGNVTAESMVIEGSVKGKIVCREKIWIKKTAKVHADITSPNIIIEDGASVFGSITFLTPQAHRPPFCFDLFKEMNPN